MSAHKLVSIIIPCYNASSFISGMTRVFEQTYDNIELVLVDDCSRDDTWQKMQELKQEHPELPIVLGHNEQNMGSGVTRNNGLKLSSGSYICFWDADDWAEPTYVEKMVQKLEQEQADFVYCVFAEHSSKEIRENSIDPELMQAKNLEEQKLLFKRFIYSPCCKLERREFLEQHQISFPAICLGEDECWTVELVLSASKIALLDEILYHYDLTTPNSITKTVSAKIVNDIVALTDIQFKYLTDNGYPEPFFEAFRKSMHDRFFYYWQRFAVDPEIKKLFAQKYYAVCSKYGIEVKEEPIPLWARFRAYRLIPPVGFKAVRTKAKKMYYGYDATKKRNQIYRTFFKLASDA